MKLFVLFFVAVVWLEMPIGGMALGWRSGENQAHMKRSDMDETNMAVDWRDGQVNVKRSGEFVKELSESDKVKSLLQFIGSSLYWKKMNLFIADDKAMSDQAFRAKWNITAGDEAWREKELMKVPPGGKLEIDKFVKSGNWSALQALLSTKDELMDEKFRANYMMGELSDDVKNSDEGGDFFTGPQWKEFVRLANLDVADKTDAEKFFIFSDWVMALGWGSRKNQAHMKRSDMDDSNMAVGWRDGQANVKRSGELVKEFSESDKMKRLVQLMVNSPDWKKFNLLMADDEDMSDQAFRAKWDVTSYDEAEREIDLATIPPEGRKKLDELVKSGKLSAFRALLSTKDELMDEKFRADYMMGELSDDVKNSDDGGNFFTGPQWKEFVRLANLDVADKTDAENILVVADWLMDMRPLLDYQ